MSISTISIPSKEMNSEELQYLNLIGRIIEKGSTEHGRNGVTRSVFGESMRFDLSGGKIPLLTSKRVAWKSCFHELMWFLSGDTDNRNLTKKGVHIWDENATREFLDSRNLEEYEEGILGPIYGWQWRSWNAPYDTANNTTPDATGNGIDQLKYIIDELRDPLKRSSRRLIVSAWNPEQLDEMALPPCHVMMQFHVREGQYLSCSMYQRSADVGLGMPFNIASYSFLTHILAKHCDLIADEFVYFVGNAHIYESHMESLKIQLSRKEQLFDFPKISIRTRRECIEDYCIEDIEWVEQYQAHEKIRMECIA